MALYVAPTPHSPTAAGNTSVSVHQHGNFVYSIHADLLDWASAEAACAAEGGHLMHSEDPEEWAFLSPLVYQFWKEQYPVAPNWCPHCGCSGAGRCWFASIGVRYNQSEGMWRTVTGAVFNGSVPEWAGGQPDYCGSRDSCAAFYTTSLETESVSVGDQPCSCQLPYICKTSMTDETTEPGASLPLTLHFLVFQDCRQGW